MSIQLILKDPDPAISLPEWLFILHSASCQDRGSDFLVCIAYDDDAIAKLTTLGLNVWATEHLNGGWVSNKLAKLDTSH